MSNDELVVNVLENSNYDEVSPSLTEFVRTYIEKLVSDISLYVDSSIVVENISTVDKYKASQELSQDITGIPSAYSAIDGEPAVLTQFAEQYSKLGIDSFDALAKEALLDFLNLHNGLFIVLLSKLNICELSLDPPKQNEYLDITTEVNGKITIIPVRFSFGVVKFLLYELPGSLI
ncbi:MAG: hypothetical protein IKX95_09390 [Lachnospiraceae bacterium]|nr:hypothetical protein [Lachnospiraceae bacterium]MBR5766984.1 hypothetical protein [Lachnospiraceae bacterium]MBR6486166.1 hypothetical protein [Lachnospiraceae bacterium]